MSDPIQFNQSVKLMAVEMTCGHVVYMTERITFLRKKDGQTFWCSVCRAGNSFVLDQKAQPPAPPEKKGIVRLLRFKKNDV
jgi:hypothetical protein